MDVHPDRSNGLTPRQTASATDAWLNAYSPALSPHALMRVFRHKIGQLSDQVSLIHKTSGRMCAWRRGKSDIRHSHLDRVHRVTGVAHGLHRSGRVGRLAQKLVRPWMSR